MTLRKMYYKSWKYLCESQFSIYAIVVLFILSSFVGFFAWENFNFVDSFLQQLIAQTEGLSTSELMSFIFLNNLQSSLFGLFFGIVLGVFPILVALLNGGVVGYVLQKSLQVTGSTQIWRLLPHGIFELPAVFISLGLGLKLGLFIFAKNKKKTFVYRLHNSVVVFLLIVIPLLVIAALIEGFLISLF